MREMQEEMEAQLVSNEMLFQAKIEQLMREAADTAQALKLETEREHKLRESESKYHVQESEELRGKLREMEAEIERLKREKMEVEGKIKSKVCLLL